MQSGPAVNVKEVTKQYRGAILCFASLKLVEYCACGYVLGNARFWHLEENGQIQQKSTKYTDNLSSFPDLSMAQT